MILLLLQDINIKLLINLLKKNIKILKLKLCIQGLIQI